MPIITPPPQYEEEPPYREEGPRLSKEVYDRIQAIASMAPIICCGFKNHPLNKGCIQCQKPLNSQLAD